MALSPSANRIGATANNVRIFPAFISSVFLLAGINNAGLEKEADATFEIESTLWIAAYHGDALPPRRDGGPEIDADIQCFAGGKGGCKSVDAQGVT